LLCIATALALQLMLSQQKVHRKANGDARNHPEDKTNPTVTNGNVPGFIPHPNGQDSPTNYYVGGV